jgi:hypothetical protein
VLNHSLLKQSQKKLEKSRTLSERRGKNETNLQRSNLPPRRLESFLGLGQTSRQDSIIGYIMLDMSTSGGHLLRRRTDNMHVPVTSRGKHTSARVQLARQTRLTSNSGTRAETSSGSDQGAFTLTTT